MLRITGEGSPWGDMPNTSGLPGYSTCPWSKWAGAQSPKPPRERVGEVRRGSFGLRVRFLFQGRLFGLWFQGSQGKATHVALKPTFLTKEGVGLPSKIVAFAETCHIYAKGQPRTSAKFGNESEAVGCGKAGASAWAATYFL